MTAAVSLRRVSVWFDDGRLALSGIDLDVQPGEHWVLLGPNGAGKSTLLGLVGGWRHPSSGCAEVLGESFGRTDLRTLRERIGYAGPRLRVPAELTLVDYLLTGLSATVQPLTAGYLPSEVRRATELLGSVGLGDLSGALVSTCSTGEAARARVARALLPDPQLLLLDEPGGGLDLPGREDLRSALDRVVRQRPQLASITTVHHLEEVPGIATHAALVRDGKLLAAGPLGLLGDEQRLSECFGRPVVTYLVGGRWHARAAARLPGN